MSRLVAPTLPGVLVLRELRFTDLRAITAIDNAYRVDGPQLVAWREQRERDRQLELPLRQIVAECAGEVVGWGRCGRESGSTPADAYELWVAVAPRYLGHGIGQEIAAELTAWAREQGRRRLVAVCRAQPEHTLRFLTAAGFQQRGWRYESALALERFDERPFAAVFASIAADGIALTTLARERRPDALERLYALAQPLLRSVQLPGDLVLDLAFDDWLALELAEPELARNIIVIARHGAEYVGYSNLRAPWDGPARTIMTGVGSSYRRRGIALALKLQSIRIARELGYRELRADNDPTNPAILALNRRLGYQPLPMWLMWEKWLHHDQSIPDDGSSVAA